MRLALIAAAFLLPLAASAQTAPPPPAAAPAPAAATPAKKPSEAARKEALALDEKLHFTNQVQAILNNIRGQLIVGIARANQRPPEQIQPIVDELLMPDFTKHANEMTGIIVDLWANNFTVDELHALRAFYDTPLGEKFLKTLPLISQDVNKQGGTWAQAIFSQTIAAHADALRQRGINPPPSGGAPRPTP